MRTPDGHLITFDARQFNEFGIQWYVFANAGRRSRFGPQYHGYGGGNSLSTARRLAIKGVMKKRWPK